MRPSLLFVDAQVVHCVANHKELFNFLVNRCTESLGQLVGLSGPKLGSFEKRFVIQSPDPVLPDV